MEWKLKKLLVACLLFSFVVLQVTPFTTKIFAAGDTLLDYSTGYSSTYYENILVQDKDATIVKDGSGLFLFKEGIKTQIDVSAVENSYYLKYLGKGNDKYYFCQPFKKIIYVLDTTTNKLVFDSNGPSFGTAGFINNWAMPSDYILGVIDSKGVRWFTEYYTVNKVSHWAICNSNNLTINFNSDDSKQCFYLTKAQDDSIWYLENGDSPNLCRINSDNTISKFPIQGDVIQDICIDSQGNIYYYGDEKIHHYVYSNGKLSNGEVWGNTEGLSLDHYGNLWSVSNGILYQVFNKDNQKPEAQVWNKRKPSYYDLEIYDENHFSVVPYSGECSNYNIINNGCFVAPEVTNLHSTFESDTSLKLEWNSAVQNNKNVSYIVYRNGEKIGTSNIPTYTDNSLSYATNYKYTVKTIDADSVLSEESNAITISTVASAPAPVISITGVEYDKTYNTSVAPKVTTDKGILSLSLNGKAYNGEVISEDGTYSLVAKAIYDGMNIEKTFNFSIDKTAPKITVQNIENNGVYYSKVKPLISVGDGTYTVTLDGQTYDGSDITSVGLHKIIITAKDNIGNSSTQTLEFRINAVLTPDTLTQVISDINKTSDKQVSVNLNGTTIVDSRLFSAIVGKDKTVSFTLDANNSPLTWSFDGSQVNTANIKNIDLAVNLQAPNASSIDKFDANAQILSFKDNGILPAPATLKIKVDTSKIDISKGVYFYYYNPSTKSTELIEGPLTPDTNGFIEVTIKHCSDYFVSNRNLATSTVSNSNAISSNASLPKTGFIIDFNALMGLGSCIIIIGFTITRRKKFNK